MKTRIVASLIIVCAALAFVSSQVAFAIIKARNTPILQLFQGDGRHFVLRQPLVYEIKKTGAIVIVPEGFVTDFASVPWVARSIIAVLGRHSVPAIVHDYLYWEQKCTRLQADLIMFDAMEEYKSTWFEKHAVWRALRLRGEGPWSINTTDRKKGLLRVIPPEYADIPANTIWSQYRQELFDHGVRETQQTAVDSKAPSYCKL